MVKRAERDRKAARRKPRLAERTPPVPKPVLRQLYRALLCTRNSRGKAGGEQHSLPDGMVAAATLPLGAHDLFIPPANSVVLRQCESLGNHRSGTSKTSKFPQVLRMSPEAHWQVAMSMHLALGWKEKRRSSAVLAMVPDFLAGRERKATLELLGEVSRLKLPIVYLTRTMGSRGAKLASDLHVSGLPRIVVDGGDPVAIYRVCQEAIRRAREGTGPTVVDCHFIADPDEVAFVEAFLTRYGLWSPEWKQQLMQELHGQEFAGKTRRA